ncbi:MAG TPA: hypothetical protein VEJ86_06630, partial [Candidatus Binataceae bacterium]|nr:hypothetical protein [Candidatus Binataceae bacterium]
MAALALSSASPALAQDTSGALTLYVDQRTGQLFNRPGPGRVKLGTYIPESQVGDIERHVEEKANAEVVQKTDEMKAQLVAQQAQQQQWNATMAQEVGLMTPAWQEFSDRWFKKISIGTLVFADYRFYTHTSF